MDDILGTSASNTSDLVLLAYVFLLLPGMIIGFFFARRKMFVPYHKLTMTGVTLVNWVLIAFVMLASYSYSVAPEFPGNLNQLYALIATVHLVTGALAQAFATYLVVLMWTERTRFEGLLPPMLRIRRIKTPMRVTLGLWITTVVLGLGLYFTWYVGGDEDPTALSAPGATEQAGPGVTEDANANLALTEDMSANLAVTENVTPPAMTEDASANLAVTENVMPPAMTEDASANLAVTENVTPPAMTEDATAIRTSTRKAPATTEEACMQLTPPAVTEDAFESAVRPTARPTVSMTGCPPPAMTEAVNDDRPRPAFTESVDDDDNSGSGSSNSGSGSSNSGRGKDDDKKDD